MATGDLKTVGKNGLPFILASIICGYATNAIPTYFPPGDLREWAYRSIPLVSICVLFIIKTLKDFGSMTGAQLVFSFCSSPEKKRLVKTINDPNVSPETVSKAKSRYDELAQKELEIGSRLVGYVSSWSLVKSKPVPPPTAD